MQKLSEKSIDALAEKVNDLVDSLNEEEEMKANKVHSVESLPYVSPSATTEQLARVINDIIAILKGDM